MKITLTLLRVSSGQGFCGDIALGHEEPWEIFVVNGDMYVPYYRVHIGGKCVGIASSEERARNLLVSVSKKMSLGVKR